MSKTQRRVIHFNQICFHLISIEVECAIIFCGIDFSLQSDLISLAVEFLVQHYVAVDRLEQLI